MLKDKLSLAIIDFTDCEGCQLELVDLKEKLLDLTDRVELVEWRLVQDREREFVFPKKVDVAIVEGTPLTQEEIGILKEIRSRAVVLVALGSCACIGGVNSILDQQRRQELKDQIYDSQYQMLAVDSRPVSAHVRVEVMIPGCPVNGQEAEEILGKLVHGHLPRPKSYPVCLECKARQNECLLLNGQPCLGPVTRGGCGALCVSHGIPCYGCWGQLEGTNLTALRKKLTEFMSEEEIKKRLDIFWREAVNDSGQFNKDPEDHRQ